jgi:hypothetical protein
VDLFLNPWMSRDTVTTAANYRLFSQEYLKTPVQISCAQALSAQESAQESA